MQPDDDDTADHEGVSPAILHRSVGLIVCIHRNADDIGPCLTSVFDDAGHHPALDLRVVVVDDASVDQGPTLVAERFPQAHLVQLTTNLGFAGANNAGLAHLQQRHPGLDYVALLNADTVVRPGWLAALVDFLDRHPHVGAAQPKILLHDEPHLINTVGNRLNYLGFGMMTAYREPDDGRYDTPGGITFPSGCAVLLRADWLAEHGLFEAAFGMYLEDADLGLRLLATGWPAWYCPLAEVLHRYTPDAPIKSYGRLERNRYLLLLTYWSWPMLLAVGPMLLLMELLQWGYAMLIGQPVARLRLWVDLAGRGRGVWVPRRGLGHRVNGMRLVSQIEMPGGGPWLLRCVVNPLMRGYGFLLRMMGVAGFAALRCAGP